MSYQDNPGNRNKPHPGRYNSSNHNDNRSYDNSDNRGGNRYDNRRDGRDGRDGRDNRGGRAFPSQSHDNNYGRDRDRSYGNYNYNNSNSNSNHGNNDFGRYSDSNRDNRYTQAPSEKPQEKIGSAAERIIREREEEARRKQELAEELAMTEDELLQKQLGFSSFGSTKGKLVPGANPFFCRPDKKRKYTQYLNKTKQGKRPQGPQKKSSR